MLIGGGIGLTTGYVLPAWLHYGFGGADSAPNAKNALLWKTKLGYIAPAPQVQLDGASLGVVGTF